MLTNKQIIAIADVQCAEGQMSRRNFNALVEDLPKMCGADKQALSKALSETNFAEVLAYADGVFAFAEGKSLQHNEYGNDCRNLANMWQDGYETEQLLKSTGEK
jgi:hypothetical protein